MVRRTLSVLGAIPTALALAGVWRAARRRELRARVGAPLAFGAVLLASLLEEVELDGGGHCDSSSECTEGDLGGRGARGRGWP
jgi:hypothetical protein